ncbi:MAG: hypothetical protein K2M69_03060 [Muribaculaceae bacterium]|nr:hypothetical protein [Muribaculaceae bacterium]
MNQTLLKIFRSREDISDYVFHFTKHRNAYETLKNILEEERIKDISNNGHICFSESPLPLLPSMFKLFQKYKDPMYAPYGIGIKKDIFWKMGGRPVIYGEQDEYNQLTPELKWRFQILQPNNYDFSWLREWRIPVAEIDLSKIDCFIVVNTLNDVDSLYHLIFDLGDIEADAQPEDGMCYVEYLGYFTRKYKIISMEEIENINNMSKNDLEKILQEQPDEDTHYLH